MRVIGNKKTYIYRTMCKSPFGCGDIIEYTESDVRRCSDDGTEFDYIRCQRCDRMINVSSREDSI